MQIIRFPEKKQWKEILARPVFDFESLTNAVGGILKDVKERGDKALIELTEKYDKVKLAEIAVTPAELAAASSEVKDELKKALKVAIENISIFHKSQIHDPASCQTAPGIRCWQKSLPIEKVGLYIPGGTAPLVSTVLMLAIPAKLAGCKEIVLCSPPEKDGKIHSSILYAANLLGVSKVYKIGGAQAIAAMAYGTETVPKVYKIFGPGNQFVQAAKLKVSLENTAIDMPAGPSEVAVMADDSAVPAFVASDLLSQAEHGIDSQVILISTSEKLIDEVNKQVAEQLKSLPRKEIAAKALENSKIILVKDDETMLEMVNEYAPEHLIIATKNYNELVNKIVNAGSVFLGNFSPESAGDYASGTNHTLPTNGNAKAYSGVNLDSFTKKITFQELTTYGLFNIGPAVEIMADAEELYAHRMAVQIRMNSVSKNYNNGKN
jgi:histidinol dehydrogenase